MSKKKVGVVCGGYTSEYGISVLSGKTVFEHLDRSLWEVYLITLRAELWEAIDDQGVQYSVSRGDFSLYHNLVKTQLDVIFNVIHGAPGENGQLAALWELINLPFTSCDSYNAALTYNKRDCLSVLREWNVPTAKHYSLNSNDPIDVKAIEKAVGFPCFVKANRAGSSFGVYKVKRINDLEKAIHDAFEEDSQLIIESALEGREVSVGVAHLNGKTQVLPITEIKTENEFFDFAAKYEGQSQEITPAEIPDSWKEAVSYWCALIYDRLGLRGVVRSEFIFVNGIPHFLEVNSVPGMTAKSIVPQQVHAMGMKLSDFFTSLLKAALNTMK